MNTVPYEIIAGTVEVYQAPVGTAFPDIDGDPLSIMGWAKVGTSGSLNYLDSDGVKVDHSQTLAFFRALGDCGSRKVFRTEEDFKIGLTMADLTLEQYANALNGNTVTADVGGSGLAKKIGLSRGFPVDTVALLVRIPFSPYVADGNTQFECPRAAQTGNPTPVFKKGEPAALALEWTALVDPNAASDDERFGRLICQTAEAAS